MFRVVHPNFGRRFDKVFRSWQAAVEFAKSKGFEATIEDYANGGIAGVWSPIYGARKW